MLSQAFYLLLQGSVLQAAANASLWLPRVAESDDIQFADASLQNNDINKSMHLYIWVHPQLFVQYNEVRRTACLLILSPGGICR